MHQEYLGIMQLIQDCEPKNILLVHGNYEKLQILRSKINTEINVDCNILQNGGTCVIETRIKMPSEKDLNLLKSGINICKARGPRPTPIKRSGIFTIHVAEEKNRIVMMNIMEVCKDVHITHQNFTFCATYKFNDPNPTLKCEDKLFIIFKEKLKDWNVTMEESSKVIVESVEMKIVSDEKDPAQNVVSVCWKNQDEDIARYILEVLCNLS